MRKITTLIGVLALASMLLAACGGGAVPTVSGEPITVVETVLVTVEVTAEGDGAVAETTPVPPPATGAGGERLQTILDRGNLICGVHGTFQGFGFLDTSGAWTGFDVEFCRAWAAALFNDADAVEFRALSAQDRFTARNLRSTVVGPGMTARMGFFPFSRVTTIVLKTTSGETPKS